MEKSLVFSGSSIVLSRSYSPERLLWRTCQLSMFEGLEQYLDRYPKSGMMRNGVLYELQISELPIIERDGSVLPTPTASDPLKHGTGGLHRRLVKGTKYSQGDHRMLPTPTAHMHKENGYPAEYNRRTPTIAAILKQDPTGMNPARVNPQFVEWMMGFDQDWTKIT